MKKSLNNNKGFSLVELLVGIAILGIIVAPLLGNFVISANTLTRSREIGEATIAAQNLSESVKQLDMDTLLGGGVTGLHTSATLTQGINEHSIAINDYSSGSSVFDIDILLTAADVTDGVTGVSEIFEIINSQDIINFSSMDAMFSQNKLVIGYGYDRALSAGGAFDDDITPYKDVNNIDDINASGDPDLITYRTVESLFIGAIGADETTIVRDKYGYITTVDSVAVDLEKERTIYIDISNIGIDNPLASDDIRHDDNSIIAYVTYEYEFSFTHEGEEYIYNPTTNPTDGLVITYDLMNIPFDVDSSGNYPVFYVLYHPYYDEDSLRNDEHIIIRNNIEDGNAERLPVDIYILKQQNPNITQAEQDTLDVYYRAVIELVQPYSATEPADHVRIFSNAGTVANEPVFRWYNGPGAYYATNWEEVVPTMIGTGALPPTSSEILETQQEYRMYEMTIIVTDQNGDEVHRLNTSKLA